MPERVLIVEDEAILRKNLVRYLEQQGHTVDGFESAEEALAAVADIDYAAALLDLRLPGRDGLSLAGDLFERSPDTGIIVMTAYSSVESVIDALHTGVSDYLIKPVMLKEVAGKIEKLVERRRILRDNARLRRLLAEQTAAQPVARSRVMLDLLAFVRQVAASSSTVLVEGESGVGKEVVARFLHEASPRREGPFVAVHIPSIPEPLLESHLFGHQRGAFPGADSPREGLFRAAHGGTLFLDEIGSLSNASQAKLLRVIESKEVHPLGCDRPVRIDVRIVASSNTDLLQAVSEKRFRADLFYRLSAIRVHVPPLRARIDDIPALTPHFVAKHARQHGRNVTGVDSAALRRLLAYPWPGNVRELSNVIERATVGAAGPLIGSADLPLELSRELIAGGGDYCEAMADFERALIGATLERTQGDRREAARLLGLSLATLYRRVDKLGLKDHSPESARHVLGREA